MDIVFRKTAKGSEEVATRAFRLQPRLRSLLILVDGQRSTSALHALIGPQCDELLAALHEQGFIAAVAQAPAAAPRPAPPVPATVERPPQATTAPGVPFDKARRDVVRDFVDRVGPMGEAMAIRMERSRNAAELAALLDTAAQIVANVRGAGAAQAFLQRHRAS